MKLHTRIIGATVSGTIVVGLLVGCTGVQRMSLILKNGTPTLAICENLSIEKIRFSTVDKTTHDSQDLWELDGAIDVDAGFTVDYGTAVAGTSETLGLLAPDLTDAYLDVHLDSHVASGEATTYFAHFDADKLSDSQWLGSDNKLRDKPC